MGRKFSDFLYKKMIKGLARVLARDGVPMPKSDTPITADETADLNLIAFGDPQISALSPLRSARVYSAVQDIKNATGHFDALLMLGDITEYGAWCEYRMTARLLEAVEDRFSKMLMLTGNHDIRIRPYKKQLRRFLRKQQIFLKAQTEKLRETLHREKNGKDTDDRDSR